MISNLKTGLWILVVAASSVAFSLVFACATPFAAIAAVSGTFLRPRSALAMTAFAWLANQAVGYLVLGYPRTWDSYGWGLAIGIAACLAVLTVALVGIRRSKWQAVLPGFMAAFAVYELALYAATAVLPSGEEAFSLSIVLQIFWTNLLGLAGLLALNFAAMSLGLLTPPERRARYA